MNKKKLIGTIIGVIAFIALIAGATFAAFSFAANVTNGTYNATTGEFKFTYSGTNEITGASMLTSSATYSTMTNAATGKYTLTITKSANSPAAGTFNIKLHVNSNGLTTNSIKYKVCPTTDCSGTISGTTLTGATAGSDISIYTSASDFNAAGSVSKTYYIYFWLDSATLVNADMNATFGGYVYASATQASI